MTQIRIEYHGEIIFTIDNKDVANMIVNNLLRSNCDITNVTLEHKETKRQAKKFILKDLEIFKMGDDVMFFWLQPNTVVYYFID